MAGELSFSLPGLTGSTLYAVLRRSTDGAVRDVALDAWEAWDDASIGDYDVAMVEQGASGRFLGDLPAGVEAPYEYEVCLLVGVSPAVSDPIVGMGAAVDPLLNPVPGSYAAGTAGAALGAIDDLPTATELADATWTRTPRTLTQVANSSTNISEPGAHTRRRGDRWSVSITGMGSLVGRTALWVTLKRNAGLGDAKSTLQITELGGLLVLNETAVTGGDSAFASITVDDEVAGDITFEVAGEETAQIEPHLYAYDVQVLLSPDGPDTMDHGTFTVVSDVTRATEAP